jgi:hypothetical protein
MMHIAQQEFMSEAQQMANRRAIRARLPRTAPKAPIRLFVAPKPVPQAALAVEPPLWQSEELKFDHHVLAFDAETSARGYMRFHAEEAGFTVADIIGGGRNRHLVSAKKFIAYGLRTKFQLSFEQIAYIMHADHSSVINRVQRYCSENSLPYEALDTGYTTDKAEKAERMFKSGIRIPAIARELKVSQNTVRNRAIIDGWYVSPDEALYQRLIANLDRDKFARLVTYGFSMSTLRRKLGASPTAIKRLAGEMGLTVAGRGQG